MRPFPERSRACVRSRCRERSSDTSRLEARSRAAAERVARSFSFLPGLQDKVGCPEANGLNGCFDAAKRGDQDHHGGRVLLQDAAQPGEALTTRRCILREVHVEQDDPRRNRQLVGPRCFPDRARCERPSLRGFRRRRAASNTSSSSSTTRMFPNSGTDLLSLSFRTMHPLCQSRYSDAAFSFRNPSLGDSPPRSANNMSMESHPQQAP